MTLRIGQRRSKRCAFTLIELILVMAMIVIVVGVTFPRLQGFFRGRTLESEARRFLTLTRYAQSRAVTEGIPMTLWIDAHEGSYGLEAQRGFLERDTKAVQYELDEKLDIEVKQNTVNRSLMTAEQQMRRRMVSSARNAMPEIHFMPDGSIDIMSPTAVCIRDGRDSALWVSQTQDRLNYEVLDSAPIQR